MKKRANGFVAPKHVDMSLTFTLVDHLARIATQQDPTGDDLGAEIVRDWIWRKVVIPWAPLLGIPVGPCVSYALHLWLGDDHIWPGEKGNYAIMAVISAVATLGIRSLLNAGGTWIKEIVESLHADFARARRHFAERQEALKLVIARQIKRADHFRLIYPDAAFVTEESTEL
jgi:hypothetical protein